MLLSGYDLQKKGEICIINENISKSLIQMT